MKYRKKPIVIEAFKWTGDHTQQEDPFWAKQAMEIGTIWIEYRSKHEPVMLIETLEGVMTAERGDYIIKGIKNELYPCKPDIFESSYEPAA